MLTASQIKWARQHDWFIEAYSDGSILVRDDIRTADGRMIYSELIIDSWTELRNWAGY